jgi:hypothetical protein
MVESSTYSPAVSPVSDVHPLLDRKIASNMDATDSQNDEK